MQKECKQKIPRKLFVHFDYDYEKDSTQKIWFDKGTEFRDWYRRVENCRVPLAKQFLTQR